MPVPKDIAGQRFGKLRAISFAYFDRRNEAQWNVRCDCGASLVVRISNLTGGHTRSCGCLRREVPRTHGMFNTPEYWAYAAAKQKCNNPHAPFYQDYGGRGIQFHFESFEQFFREIGNRPSPRHSVDRINNDGHYEPGNIRWATPQQQARNRRHQKKWAKKLKHEIAPSSPAHVTEIAST